ncbi:ubiquitin-like protein, putative [Plasmodium gallinaceum]|uniref:Ubiquitin-like protein, putative n=1 Tax=Plasmodium gallinaceum TaxID=5849 RepID=A0A1J1GV82_PLAGA|nr:ubiquitin-like protein, putative [Plasmodium gallinaceum]CRG96370.1 ubiquitin-like protein, putative [Plasmodium gallinaceum]
MEEYRNNSEERKKSEDICKKKLSDLKKNFVIDYKNSKHEFIFLKENENKKREIDEDNFYIEKKIKDNKMPDSVYNKEKSESIIDFDNIDVSEYKNIISNSYSSDDCDDQSDDSSQNGELLESYDKRKSHIFQKHGDDSLKNISDINPQNVNMNNKKNNEALNLGNHEKKKNNEIENLKTSENIEILKTDEIINTNNKINLNTYLYVRLKTNDSTNNIFKCRIDRNITVKKLKKCLKKILNTENEYRIIYRGRLLKDMENLSKYNIKFNDIIYVIKLNRKKNGNDVALDSGITSSQLSTIKDEYNDLGKFSDNDNISKLISYMFDHSDFIKSIMDSNKQLQKLREKNPDLNHMLNDSQALKQSFEMIKNPSLMKELMRNTDRAISNIEAIPGGFNTLRRMYHNIQEPMYSSNDRLNEKKMNKIKQYDLNSSSPPTSEAFPNPWATKEKNSKNQNSYNNLEKCLLMNNNNPFNNSNDMFKMNNKNNEDKLNNNIFKTNIIDLLQKYQTPSNKSNNIKYDKKNILANNEVENKKIMPNNGGYENNLNLFNSAFFNNNIINNIIEQNKKNENTNINKSSNSKVNNASNLLNHIISNLNKNLNINDLGFNRNSHKNVDDGLSVFNSPNNATNSILSNNNNNNNNNKNDNTKENDNTISLNNNSECRKDSVELEKNVLSDLVTFTKDDNNLHNQNIDTSMNVINKKEDINKSNETSDNYKDSLNININKISENININNENINNENSNNKNSNNKNSNNKNSNNEKSVNENNSNLTPNYVNNENRKEEISNNIDLMESKDNENNKNLYNLNIVDQMNNLEIKNIAETIKLLRCGNNNMNEQNFYKLYAEELNSLKLMGFTDTQKCIKALVDTKGNIERAIDLLLDDINSNKN